MLKRLLPVAFILCCSLVTSAQTNPAFELVSQTATQAVVKVNVPAPVFNAVQTPNGTEYTVSLEHGTPILKKGAPDLQKLSAALACPDGKKWSIANVVTGPIADYHYAVAPSKGNLYRDVSVENVPYTYDAVYTQNAPFPETTAYLRAPYVLRDFAAQALVVQPDTYDAATQTLHHSATVTVTLKAVADAGGVLSQLHAMPITAEFDKVYAGHFINYNVAKQTRFTQLEEQGDMLVICYDSFMTAMQPFVNWKNQKGLRTVMVPVSSVGTTDAAIKTYIQNYYNANNLAYVLLVGDAAQVPPSSTANGTSDNNYGYLTGDDSYPEIFIGRFSANSVAELEPQVQKSIDYEKNPTTGADAAWYKRGIVIGSNVGAGEGLNGWADWNHERHIRTMLLGYNYNDVQELYDGDHSGAGFSDAAGNPTPQNLIDQINQGASVMNYTGHGDWNEIVTTAFGNADVAGLTNVGKWPFVWIVGCNTGTFEVNTTCFAEALARATTPAGPTGAVASMMSTILQSWEPPMEAQYEFNQILTESIAGNVKRTFAGISMNGCMGMNDAYGADGAAMTDTWTLFGDPSLTVRTDVPAPLVVTHPDVEPVGVSSLQINCNTNGALACLTLHGQILSTATVAGGVATFSFEPVTAIDTLLVTVTAYNKVPYTGNVLTVPANGPYVIPFAHTVHDPAGNNDGFADFSESILMQVDLKNVGLETASGVTATLSTTDPYLAVTDGNETYGAMEPDALHPSANAFGLNVSDTAPDGHLAYCDLTVSDGAGNVWHYPIGVELHAPNFTVVSYSVDDASGNGNGWPEPGETVTLTVNLMNRGSASAPDGMGTLTTNSQEAAVVTPDQAHGPIGSQETVPLTFGLTVASDAALYSLVPLDFVYDAAGYSASKTLSMKVGQATEDFETNDLSSFDWQSPDSAWTVTDVAPYEGTYCLRSGQIGNNGVSTLMIETHSAMPDTVRFASRVSSESTYDFLHFYIDSVDMDSWSGEVGWHVTAYPVDSGTHTLSWKYVKDPTDFAGADAAWLDDIVLPLNSVAKVVPQEPTFANAIGVYPNPANAEATLLYSLDRDGVVSIDMFNVLGQRMAVLQAGAQQAAGVHTLQLNTAFVPSGQYIVVMTVNGISYSRKLEVIK